MQCGRGGSVGDRLVENYSGLLPLLWKAVLRYKERYSSCGSYEKLHSGGGMNIDDSAGLEQQTWGSSGSRCNYRSGSKSGAGNRFVSNSNPSRRRRWRITFRVPKVLEGSSNWKGLRPARRLGKY